MKVLICGSRNWRAKDPVRAILRGHGPHTTLIHGGYDGADKVAGWVAQELGLRVITVEAEWQKHGKAAGPIRNGEMIKLRPDIVYAFRSYGKSRGTDDMVRQAEAAGIPVYVISGGPRPPKDEQETLFDHSATR